jgi:4-hydroxybenzoate polyprenyltransferase
VSLAVVSFGWVSFKRMDVFSYAYLGFILSSTIAAYNYMRIVQIPDHMDDRNFQKFWLNRHLVQALFFTTVFSVFSAYFYFQLFSLKWVVLSSPAILVSILYPLGFKNPFRSFTSLRSVPGLKLLLIAVSWSYITHLIPVLLFDTLDWLSGLEFVFRSVFVAALVIPFDIRDLGIDESSMKTLPQTFGIHKAKLIAFVFTGIYLLWKGIEYQLGVVSTSYFLSWVGGILFLCVLIFRMNNKRSELYCGFWIEATPIVVAILLLLLN